MANAKAPTQKAPALKDASPRRRFVSFIIDLLVVALILGAAIYLLSDRFGQIGLASALGESIVIQIAIIILYFTIAPLVSSGLSVGKYFTCIRLVMDDGSPITAKACVIRALAHVIDFFPYVIPGLLMMLMWLFVPKVKGLGDLWAHTRVMYLLGDECPRRRSKVWGFIRRA